MLFVSLPLRNLSRRPIRSLLTALGVSAAVATLIALIGVSRGVETAWTHSMTERGVHMLGMRKDAVEILTGALDQAIVEEIAQVPGIKAVSGELADLLRLEGSIIGVTGWPSGSFLWETLRLKEGRAPSVRETQAAVIGQRLAERFGLKVGDGLPLLNTTLTLVGITQQAGTLNENVIILPLPTLQALLNKQRQVTVVNLRLHAAEEPEKVARVQALLAERFPDVLFLETKDLTDANQMLKLLRRMSWSVSLIALMMGLFFILNTLLMSVTERTREMGILAALGWHRRRIWAMVMMEGLLLSAAGSILGLAAGVLGLNRLKSMESLEGFIEPALTLPFFLEVFFAAALLGVLGSLYPAWRTSRLNTVQALKYE